MSNAETPARLEKHYTIDEIAAQWHLGYNTVKRMFADEPGVLKIGEPTRLMGGRKYKRRYLTMRIPESVLLRVQDRLVHKRPARAGGLIDTDGRSGGLHAS